MYDMEATIWEVEGPEILKGMDVNYEVKAVAVLEVVVDVGCVMVDCWGVLWTSDCTLVG